MSKKTTLVLCAAILLVAAAVVALIFSTEPEATRGGATKETAMLVDVVTAEQGSFRPRIEVMGTVAPERDVVLSPRVDGEVVARADGFTPGGFVERGEVLVRIDPADYENELAQAKADLRSAEADLALEMGRQDIARRDLELLGDSVGGENEDLVLRKPQLNTVRARVESAQAAVGQAELNLRRTTIRAPFDAHVLRRDVDVGSQVAAGATLGRLVGVETYWVQVTVPLSKLRQIAVPDGSGETGSEVRLRDRAAWAEGVYRVGRVHRLLGELADSTRMARLLVTVDDPLARRARSPGITAGEDDAEDIPPLMIGSFVEARIEGEEIRDVVRVDRDYLRGDDKVWVMEDGQLNIRDVEVAFRDARHVYLAAGVEAGEQIVVTNLSTVVDGAALRLEGESSDDTTGSSESSESSTGEFTESSDAEADRS